MSKVKCQMSNVKCQMSNDKCQMSYVQSPLFRIAKITSESISEIELGLCQYHLRVLCHVNVKSQMSNVKCQMSNVK